MLREWQLLLTDSWLRALVSWVPLLIFFILWWIFSAGIPREQAIGIVDFDRSDFSRALVRQYNAHPGLTVVSHFSNTEKGSAAMQNAKINALVVIPTKFKIDILKGKSPQVTTFYNSQYLLIGNMIASSLQTAHATYGAKLEVVKAMSQGDVGVQALGAAVPIGTQITPLFNSNTNYANFLVSGLIPGSWQIIIVLITILALSRESRLQGLAAWLGKKPIAAIAGKLIPYTLILWAHGAIFLWFMFIYLQWPMNGSWTILILGQFLMVVASQAIGLLLYLLLKDAAHALSMAAAYTAPSFAFMGITFPASDMTIPAQIWRNFIPVSHYIDIQLHQANHGASVATALPQMVALLLFFVVFIGAYKLAQGIIQKEKLANKNSQKNELNEAESI